MEICIFYWVCVCVTVHHNLWLLIRRSTENCQSSWNSEKEFISREQPTHKYHWIKWFSSFVWRRVTLNVMSSSYSTFSYHSTLIFDLNCFIFYSNVFIRIILCLCLCCCAISFVQLKSKRLAESVDLIWQSTAVYYIHCKMCVQFPQFNCFKLWPFAGSVKDLLFDYMLSRTFGDVINLLVPWNNSTFLSHIFEMFQVIFS